MIDHKIGDTISIWWGGINATIKHIIDDKILVLRMNDTNDLLWAIIEDNDHSLTFIYDNEEINTKDL